MEMLSGYRLGFMRYWGLSTEAMPQCQPLTLQRTGCVRSTQP
jgi:hypothetical protein